MSLEPDSPLADVDPAAAPAEAAEPAPARLLLVDDEPGLRTAVQIGRAHV